MFSNRNFIHKLAHELETGISAPSHFFKQFGWGAPPYKDEQFPLYVGFMEQVVSLETAGYAIARLIKTIQREKRLIDLLEGPQEVTVLLEGWGQKGKENQRLFFSRYDIGADLDSESL